MQWNLIRLRKERKIDQKKMAELLGISAEQYSNKERGEYQFKADEMFKIREFFGLPLEQIFLPRNFDNIEVKKGGK